ncbi:putative ATP-dependent RNA helicase DDX51 [Apostichopus japonicus]|uniref:ATP-dependent RNA helicase n=1 Tax=Stichopus japonicus TaxID=307972 RepID=A0A2G8KEV0_STIJA|nr:putative ATP-dependent RNA helicase DDX51 [Apostichopus japonicus]
MLDVKTILSLYSNKCPNISLIHRFTGEEEATSTAPSQSILEKLHKKAEERKRQKQLTEKRKRKEESGKEVVEDGDRKKRKRTKQKRDDQSGNHGEDEDDDDDTRNGGVHDEGATGQILDYSHGNDEESDRRRRKKKDEKRRKADGMEHNESIGYGDSGKELEEGDAEGKIDSPTDVREKKKKKRKKRSKGDSEQTEAEILEGDVSVDDTSKNGKRKRGGKKDKRRRKDEDDVNGEDSAEANGEGEDGPDEKGETENNGEKLFPVLGDFSHAKKEKVHRVLPEWLAKPTRISGDVEHQSVSLSVIPGLDERILAALAEMEISSFFPVQAEVIPLMLQSARHGIYLGPGGYHPGDLCVAAPTGSGKTLAFAVPIVQILINRVRQRFRALVVLPTKNLAAQVYKVFLGLCQKTPLKVVMIGGQRTIKQEEDLLVKRSTSGESFCGGDILVATPGRLIDHINHTEGFTLKHLRFLVIDEADSMMVQLSKDWITKVERAVYKDTPYQEGGSRHPRGSITVESESRMEMPLQKVLFSATLSHNPEQLSHLKLFQPQLVTTKASHYQKPTNETSVDKDEPAGDDSYVIPSSLEELYMVCTSGEKPLVIAHLLQNLGLSQVLCFTNSVESSHRLYLLLDLMGDMKVGEFSSKLSGAQRQNMIKQFKNESIRLLICSDAMTRGMDLSNAKYVISYDPPLRLKTYIHRVGRTARAGRKGTAYTILLKEEVGKFMKMVKRASSKGIQQVAVESSDFDDLVDRYQRALKKLPQSLKFSVPSKVRDSIQQTQ